MEKAVEIRELTKIYNGKIKALDEISFEIPSGSIIKTFKGLADKFELTTERKVGELSQGNRTKLYISLAFSQDVSLYVLDEPTWGLDPIMRKNVLDTIKAFAINGKTIVYSSHILSEVEEVCDRMIILKSGKIAYDGTVDDLKDKTGNDLSNAFLNLVKGGDEK